MSQCLIKVPNQNDNTLSVKRWRHDLRNLDSAEGHAVPLEPPTLESKAMTREALMCGTHQRKGNQGTKLPLVGGLCR